MATILIVDDRPTNREYLLALLGDGGHRLLEASDGAEALAIARADPPDLVITDILMPTMDGYEFVRQLRANQALADTPVIFCTAHYHEPQARQLAQACGVSHVLFKPAEPELVLRTVDAALGVRPPPAPPPAREFEREHLRLLTDKLSEKAEELRRSNDRLTVLVNLALELGSERDPCRLLQSLCHAARGIIGAKYAIAAIPNGDRSELRFFFTSGMDAETVVRMGSPDPRRGGPATVLRESRCVRLNNPGSDPTLLDFPPAYPPYRSWLGAPILSPSHVYGWIGLLDKVGADAFSDEDERLSGILAAQVGRIYENGTFYADALHHASSLELEIAQRKRAEKALQESEERSRQLLDSTAEAIYGIELAGNCTFCNPACLRLLGYREQSQLLGQNMHCLIHHHRPDGTPYPATECRIYQAFRKAEGTHVEDEVFWRADGSSFPCEYWSYPIRSNGKIIGAVVTFLDITERRQLEAQFRQAQERLQHVVASSPAILLTLALEEEGIKGISWISDNLGEILGYSSKAALGREWFRENIHPEDRDRIMADTHAELLGHGRTSHEYRFRHGNGLFRWIRAELRLIVAPNGRPVEVVGSLSDITERKQLEDQYRQSQKMEAVGRLAGGVAHDFNNLLTIINGYGEIVLGRLADNDPIRELIKQVVAAGDRAAGLTRQLLAFSRKAILEPKVLDLNVVVADVDKMLRRVIGEDIQLSVNADPALNAVKADPGQIEQVIMNLVVNARDAMPRGGHLSIELRNVDLDASYTAGHPDVHPGPYALLAVTDTGCGMDEATAGRIFEPFFSTKGDKGTGLGLATVHGIVKQSGGHVAVYSELGHGTTFKVYLPHAKETVVREGARPGFGPMPRGTETVLLVEDEDGVRALSRHVLQSCGYTVLEACDGQEAVRMAQQHGETIHALITDVVMPRMGGREVAQILSQTYPEMKVLFLSGYTDDAIVRHGILQAEVAFLQKPFVPSALAIKVREVFDRK